MELSYLECVFNTDPSGLVVVVKDDGEVIGQWHEQNLTNFKKNREIKAREIDRKKWRKELHA